MGKGAPTLEEFTDLVKKSYDNGLYWFDKKRTDKYFYGDEAQGVIARLYRDYLEEYKNHEVGDEGFRIGCVAAVASTLELMFE